MKTKSIGLLELGYRSGKDSITALNDVVDYALHAERLGYSRFWLAAPVSSSSRWRCCSSIWFWPRSMKALPCRCRSS